MKFTRLAMSATVASLGAAATLALGAGLAAAAPSGPSAADTIADLQSKGYNVVVNRVGTGSMDNCSVMSVSSVVRQAPIRDLATGRPTVQRTTTAHVNLSC